MAITAENFIPNPCGATPAAAVRVLLTGALSFAVVCAHGQENTDAADAEQPAIPKWQLSLEQEMASASQEQDWSTNLLGDIQAWEQSEAERKAFEEEQRALERARKEEERIRAEEERARKEAERIRQREAELARQERERERQAEEEARRRAEERAERAEERAEEEARHARKLQTYNSLFKATVDLYNAVNNR